MKKSRLLVIVVILALVLGLLTISLAAAGGSGPEPKDEAIGGLSVVPSGTGGPDAYGYRWWDTGEPSCSYQWVDATISGTFIVEGDDTSSGPIALSVPFNFYGTSYNQLVMASNGYLSTDPTDTGGDLSNDCPLPANPSTGGGARFYPLHDDLDLEPGIGQGFMEEHTSCPRPGNYGDEPCSVWYWDEVAQYPGGATAPTWDMEVILYHTTGQIVYQIGAGNPDQGSGSTTGIQDPPPPTIGLTYACNVAGSIPDDTVVCIEPPIASTILSKTVSLDGSCGTSDTVNFPAGYGGQDVTYCYYMTNTGNMTVTEHTVADSELGTLLGPGFPAAVGPGSSAWFTVTTHLTQTTVNTATWTVTGTLGMVTDSASATDSATAIQGQPTGVSLSSFSGENAAIAPIWLAVLLLLLLGTGVALRRKIA